MQIVKNKSKREKNPKRKSNIRELTNKERFLITLLAIVILFWISFKYIIDPQLIKVSTLEAERDTYSLQIEENNRMLKDWDSIVAERNNLFTEKELIEKDFFKTLSQPEIIYILNELLLSSDIEMESITFTKPFMEVLNEKEIQKMDISIPFKGDFQSLSGIIEEIEKEPRKMIINNIDIDKDEETEIVGNIILGVYSLNGLVEANEAEIVIETTEDNESNPFIPYSGYVDPAEKAKEEERIKEEERLKEEERIKEEERLRYQQIINNSILNQQGVQAPENQNSSSNQSSTPIGMQSYDTYQAVKGDNISYISKRKYGSEKYVDEILRLNNMLRSSILPIGKEVKLMKK